MSPSTRPAKHFCWTHPWLWSFKGCIYITRLHWPKCSIVPCPECEQSVESSKWSLFCHPFILHYARHQDMWASLVHITAGSLPASKQLKLSAQRAKSEYLFLITKWWHIDSWPPKQRMLCYLFAHFITTAKMLFCWCSWCKWPFTETPFFF